MPSERYDAAMTKIREAYGAMGEGVIASVSEISPDFARYVAESFGDLCGGQALEPKTREISIVSALATLGHTRPQLKVHLHGALNAGCTQAEIIATLAQLSLYCGVPASLNALFAANEVFRERALAAGAARVSQ